MTTAEIIEIQDEIITWETEIKLIDALKEKLESKT